MVAAVLSVIVFLVFFSIGVANAGDAPGTGDEDGGGAQPMDAGNANVVGDAEPRIAQPTAQDAGPQLAPLQAPQTAAAERQLTLTELAPRVQNPLSGFAYLPFNNNVQFGIGPKDKVGYLLNFQPLVPVTHVKNINFIASAVVPFAYSRFPKDEVGLRDSFFAVFVAPEHVGNVAWGLGPASLLPTATSDTLGRRKFAIGGAGIVIATLRPFVLANLVQDVISPDGEVHQFFMQPLVYWNFPHGWFLTTAPLISGNWKVPFDQGWIVPVGAGGGKLVRLGSQTIQFHVVPYWNVIRPPETATWTVRFSVLFVFPRGFTVTD